GGRGPGRALPPYARALPPRRRARAHAAAVPAGPGRPYRQRAPVVELDRARRPRRRVPACPLRTARGACQCCRTRAGAQPRLRTRARSRAASPGRVAGSGLRRPRRLRRDGPRAAAGERARAPHAAAGERLRVSPPHARRGARARARGLTYWARPDDRGGARDDSACVRSLRLRGPPGGPDARQLAPPLRRSRVPAPARTPGRPLTCTEKRRLPTPWTRWRRSA